MGTYVHTGVHTHTMRGNILALTVDEGCKGPGINQIRKQKRKASTRQEGPQQVRACNSGEQMHLRCSKQLKSKKKKKKWRNTGIIKKRGDRPSLCFFFYIGERQRAEQWWDVSHESNLFSRLLSLIFWRKESCQKGEMSADTSKWWYSLFESAIKISGPSESRS